MNDTIFLIGARATGKTTIGMLLAKNLDMQFVDMDKIIEKRAGQTIKEIVDRDGWQAFRKRELELLEELSHKAGLIVATGGGAVLHQDIWPRIKAGNFVVWLQADSTTTRARMEQDSKSHSQRPSLTGDTILDEAERVFKKREPLYRKSAHLEVKTEQSPDTIVTAVTKEYQKTQTRYSSTSSHKGITKIGMNT